MSQNQSYFWQTTRRNVFLKRSAKLQLFLAMLAVLTYSTICLAEIKQEINDDNSIAKGVPAEISPDDKPIAKDNLFDIANEIQNDLDGPKDASKVNAGGGFIDAFTASLSVILFTELGDKTFFIAAIMAMRHPRLVVFTGAITALALMTILSVAFGMAATIIPKVYTYYISTALFAIFGLKMIYEGYVMKATDAQEELEEVQLDLRKREDELLRAARSKFEEIDTKRKNSNSDKEDDDDEQANVGKLSKRAVAIKHKNHPEMEHRQRKHVNGKQNKSKNNNNNINGDDADDSGHELNNAADDDETIKMPTTTTTSPALSSIASSNQTNQTNCDEFINNSPNKTNFKANVMMSSSSTNNAEMSPTPMQHHNNNYRRKLANSGGGGGIGGSCDAALVHTTRHGKNVTERSNSINSLSSSHSIGQQNSVAVAAAGQPNGELKQLENGGIDGGVSKKRLERDVTAVLVQDPESGVVRKNSKKSAAYLTTRILMQAFTMTFLAEWGDRSQLTTIILAASKDYYGVIAGGIIGHSICTGLAVIGGRIVAAKISVRTVTIVGGIVFLGFALYALIMRPDDI